jgi:hypothetical protein
MKQVTLTDGTIVEAMGDDNLRFVKHPTISSAVLVSSTSGLYIYVDGLVEFAILVGQDNLPVNVEVEVPTLAE